MIIDCIADTHGYYPKLDGGDLLIVAGDLTARDEPEEYIYFHDWLSKQDYKKRIVIAGNHDNNLELDYVFGATPFLEIADYLCDSGTEFEGLQIWGSPWTKTFPRMNPRCKAFTCDTEEELYEKFVQIPEHTDILITHSPPRSIRDMNANAEFCGSISLMDKIWLSKIKLHIFGHIHECGGQDIFYECGKKYINASHVNERYKPVNKPIRVIL